MRLAISWCYFEAQMWNKDSSIAPFYLFSLFWAFFFFLWHFFWDNALLNDDHHTFIYLQLNNYNSILEQSMALYECLRQYTGITMKQSDMYEKIMNGGFATNTMLTT